MRIERIRLHNFKGILDMEFTMSTASAIILGGKNGYGKTTIFDALELVFTGFIERYKDYADDLIDHRRALNKYELPLVCDARVPEIRVEVDFSQIVGDNHQEYTIMRKANIADMNNPVDFSVFRQLYLRSATLEEHPITPEEWTSLGIDKFQKTYATLGYLSQEEATLFVKSSDAERVSSIQYLFNTKRFDDRIEKIDKLILKGAKRCADELKTDQESIRNRISDLQRYQIGAVGEQSDYNRIFKEEAHIGWDAQDPNQSNEEYYSLLAENGVLDDILYMVNHKDDIKKYRKVSFLNSVIEKAGEYALYWQYREGKELIALWKSFDEKVATPCHDLELPGITFFSMNCPKELVDVVTPEILGAVDEEIEKVKTLYNTANAAERAYNEMIDQRNRLEIHLKAHAEQVSQTSCPLCGQQFRETEELLQSITRTSRLQVESVKVFSAQAAQEFAKLKTLLHEHVVTPVMLWFSKKGITKEIVDRYLQLDATYLEQRLSLLIEKGYIAITPGANESDSLKLLLESIDYNRELLDESLDYMKLMETHNAYGKQMTQEGYEVQSIMKKRAYLLKKWSQQKSAQMETLQKALQQCNKKLDAANALIRDVKAIKEEIIRQKNEWIAKVIGDVEILFYIYSGRIMQDNFFGRGLFMKMAPGKYIYFVSDYHSDVDALYKMSSGQLVALMMSLLLSLNKLYATEKFIAIDDPVQTIDDINVWGFVETLRHEFKNYQLLFSTHELSYGSFLRYKLSRMGITTEYRDMMQERIK